MPGVSATPEDTSWGSLGQVWRLRSMVEEQNACALPGVAIRYDSFMTVMWRAVSKGFVEQEHAEFVADGLTNGFDCGIDVSQMKGHR